MLLLIVCVGYQMDWLLIPFLLIVPARACHSVHAQEHCGHTKLDSSQLYSCTFATCILAFFGGESRAMRASFFGL